MLARPLVRRWRADRPTLVATILAVVASMVMLAAGPIFADAVSLSALRNGVADGAATDLTIGLSIAGDEHPDADTIISTEVADAVEPLDVETTRLTRADASFSLETPSGAPVADSGVDALDLVANLVAVVGIDDRVTITSGRAPAHDGPRIEMMVDERIAALLDMSIGDRVDLEQRIGDTSPISAVVVGLYTVDDVDDPFWTTRDRVVDAIGESSLFRTVQLVVPTQTIVGGSVGRFSSSWLAIPDLSTIDRSQATDVAAGVGRLDERLTSMLRPNDVDRNASWELTLETSLPEHLRSNTRSLTVARSTVFAVMAGMALVAGLAVILMATLTVQARRLDTMWWTARGASVRQLVGGAAIEAALIAVPAAVVAPLLARLVLLPFRNVGPLSDAGIDIDPQANATAWVVTGLAALATVALLVVPVWRSQRRSEQPRRERQLLRGPWQRAGADIGIIAVAAIAYWQLRTLGDDRAASVRGRFGVDPLVIVAPTLGLLAGAFVAVRIVPALARLADRFAARTTGLTGALAGFELARRPKQHRNAVMFLVVSAAFGVYALSFEATWTASQADQADHQIGADARISPNRRTGDSIVDLALLAVHESVDGVERSVPVVTRDVDLPGTDRALLMAVDAAHLVSASDRFDGPDSLDEALERLVAQRPELRALELPGTPLTIEVGYEAEVTDPLPVEPDDEAEPGVVEPPPRWQASVTATVRDGRGLMHRVELGRVDTEAGKAVLRGLDIVATPPLALVDIELVGVPVGASMTVEVEFGPVAVSEHADDRTEVAWSSMPWRARARALGTVFQPPSIDVSVVGDEQLRTVIETGTSFTGAPMEYTIEPAGADSTAPLAIIATQRWLDESGTSVGDEIPAGLSEAEGIEVVIVAAVNLLPTIDPDDAAAVMVDLASLQRREHRTGLALSTPDEYWLRLDPAAGPDEVADALLDAPIESVDVVTSSRRLSDLLSDPPALAAVGGLALGFGATVAIAGVGLVATASLSARSRRREFALLRSLGMSVKSLRRSILLEQVTLVAIATALGTLVGVGLSMLVLPAVSLTSDGAKVVPSVDVVIPWMRVVVVLGSIMTAMVIGLALTMRGAARVELAASLRSEDDQ